MRAALATVVAVVMLISLPLGLRAEKIGANAEPALNPALESDVIARSGGNDRKTATAIARQLFARVEPVQIVKIVVDHVGDHRVAELLISGVKFHHPLTRREFTDETLAMIAKTLSYSSVEEVDVRTVVPVAIGKGSVVSGDNAVPTFRDVFTVTALRGESIEALRQRIDNGIGVYWEPWFLHEQLLASPANP